VVVGGGIFKKKYVGGLVVFKNAKNIAWWVGG
jgi:hypothetical protein